MATKVNSEPDIQIRYSNGKREEDRKWWYSNPFAKKTLRQTLMDMTLHGVPKVADPDRVLWSRLSWLLVVLFSVSVFLAMFYWLAEDYYSYPYKTMVDSVPTDRLPFPAISICNINTLDVTLVPYAQPLRDIMSWTAFGDFNIPADEVTDQHWQVLNMSAQTILEDTAPGLNATLKACFYDNKHRDCSRLFDFSYWAMARCFTLNVSKLALASASSALRVIVDVNQPGYVLQADKSAGVKFFVHSVEELPNLNAPSHTAAPGFSTQVAMSLHETEMLDRPYKTYGNRYCVMSKDVDTSSLPIKGRYHLLPCLRYRAEQYAVSKCTCNLPFESEPGLPNCTLHQMLTCVMPVLEELTSKNRYNVSAILGCPLPCDFEQYGTAVTFSYFPSMEAEQFLKDRNMLTNSTHMRQSILQLEFYYSEMVVRTTKYVPDYTAMTIMGSVGGNMGVFLGASMVSLMEAVELLLIGLFRLLLRLFRVGRTP